jgi:hypothetical protein
MAGTERRRTAACGQSGHRCNADAVDSDNARRVDVQRDGTKDRAPIDIADRGSQVQIEFASPWLVTAHLNHCYAMTFRVRGCGGSI